MKKKLVVSFIIVAYNAETALEKSLESLKKQNYPHSLIEVILVDSASTDGTLKIFKNFKKNNNEFKRILILNNPKKILPCGWNVALNKATGNVILRVDAHSFFDSDFISNNVMEINKGEDIVGGHLISVCENENSIWQKMMLITVQSLFGSGIAKFRRLEKREYVDTLAHAMYRSSVFDKVGLYNEKLARTEDNEMHYRMRQAGFKFLLSPDIVSYQIVRNSLVGMIKQKFNNGKWIGITIKYCPKCFSLYHFVPMLFVISLIISLILFLIGFPYFLVLIAIMYSLFNIINLISIIINNEFHFLYLLLPFCFFVLHISYGFGTIVGLLKIPFIKD